MRIEQYYNENQEDIEEFFEIIKNEYNEKSMSTEEFAFLKEKLLDTVFDFKREGTTYQGVITLKKVPYTQGHQYHLYLQHNCANAKYYEGVSYIKGGPQNRFHFYVEEK